MLQTVSLLGFSMVPQKNRRFLVIATYVLLIAVLASVVIIPSELGRYRQVLASLAVVLPVMLSFQIFGKVVEQTVFPQPRVAPMTLGLIHTRRDPGEPDERDVAIRNAAYFKAYRLLASYLIFVCLMLWSAFESGSRLAIWLLVFPLLVFLPTLPQAVILWSEPDVPDDAKL